MLSHSQVYEYRWNPLARRYRLDLESPETMPEEIEFKPAGGMRWPNGRQLLFSVTLYTDSYARM